MTADCLVVVVRAADHGQHLPGARVDNFGRAVVDVARPQVGPVDVVGDGGFGHLLHVVIKGGRDAQAATGDHRIPVLLAELPEHVVDEPGRLEAFLNAAVLVLELLLDRLVVLGLADVVVAEHVAKDKLLPRLRVGCGRGVIRIQSRRSIGDRGQHRRLGDVEVFGGLVEVGLRRRLGTVGRVAVKDLVEVQREDVVFGEATLDLQRQHNLAHLPLKRAIVSDEHPLDQLLGDRARALLDALVGDIRNSSRGDSTDVDPLMGVELAILECDRGIDQVRGDRRQWDDGPDDAVRVFDVEQDTVAVIDFGRLGEFLGIERAGIGQVAGVGLVLVDGLGASAEAQQADQGEPDDDDLVPGGTAAPRKEADREHADRGTSGGPVLLWRHRVYNG